MLNFNKYQRTWLMHWSQPKMHVTLSMRELIRRSLLRVLIKSIILQQKSAGGGSTITQQLAKNMFGRQGYGFLSMPVNKTKEIILASRLESIYSKEDILTLYLEHGALSERMYWA